MILAWSLTPDPWLLTTSPSHKIVILTLLIIVLE